MAFLSKATGLLFCLYPGTISLPVYHPCKQRLLTKYSCKWETVLAFLKIEISVLLGPQAKNLDYICPGRRLRGMVYFNYLNFLPNECFTAGL